MQEPPVKPEPSVLIGKAVERGTAVGDDSAGPPSAASELVEQVAALTADSKDQRLELPSGRTVGADPAADDERLVVRSPAGEVELQIAFNEHGPVLHFRSADLALESTGQVSVDCDRFRVRAKNRIEHRTGGDRKK